MEKLFELIIKLKANRNNVPQFLFIDGVYGLSMIKTRKAIELFKKNNPDSNEIDFIINSPGGQADDAYRIIRTLRKNFETVNIIVPFWAKSAATLLALGGSKIIMDEFGEFGPLDAQLAKLREDGPQYDRESALNDEHSLSRIETRFKEMYESMYIRLFEHSKINLPKNVMSQQLLENLSKFYKPLLAKIDPYQLGEKRRKLEIGEQYAIRILAQFGSPISQQKIRELVYFLVNGCPDHGYVIDLDLVSLFLTNVFTAEKTFGKEYANILSEISLFMIEELEERTEYVAFVETKQEEASKITDSKQVILPNKVEDKGDSELGNSQTTTNIVRNGKQKKHTAQ